MKLFIAILISLGFEAFTYSDSLSCIINLFESGYGVTTSHVLSITPFLIIKCFLLSILIEKKRTIENILIIGLCLFSIADSLLIALFINNAIYDILIDIKEAHDMAYRFFEMVCILFNALCLLRYLHSDHSGSGNESPCNPRVGGDV